VEHCAAGRLDKPLIDISMLSSEEASTQNRCEKLEEINPVLWMEKWQTYL
jgi:hypothetical protein